MGILPAERIASLIDDGAIALGAQGDGRAQLQPASLALTLGRRAWRVRASFLPTPGQPIAERLADGLAMREIDLADGALFERGGVYLVELRERLDLPARLAASANPKSSTGRIDVFVRLVAECAAGARPAFDEAPAGYAGPLYAEICPRTFSIVAREGSSLNQLRLREGPSRLTDEELVELCRRTRVIDAAADIDGGLGLSVDLRAGPVVGWRARRHAAAIDVDRTGALDPDEYFEAVPTPRAGFLILDPDEFYILASSEALSVPPEFAAEMRPISPGLGEFRVHYAGFFDPGFGWSESRGSESRGSEARGSEAGWTDGSRAVLEVRSRDAPFALEHGQLVARLVYERLTARPRRLYGAGPASHYQGQRLKLSKHFRPPRAE
ncbi:MAG: 2'-deoxycytidine 5'-triphosphate deaminase [Parvularculaceae bacterium]